MNATAEQQPDDDLRLNEALTDAVRIDVAFISEYWPDMLAARTPGTARPWRQALLDPERRTQQLARDREERAVRDPDAPGFTSAPMHVDVLDVMVDAWVALDELTDRLKRVSVDTNMPAAGSRRLTDIEDLVRFIERRLEPGALDVATLGRIGRRLTKLTVEMSRTLGLIRAGQLLNGAVCPWCRGVTPKHPAGGAITMRVEEIAPAKAANDMRPSVEAVHAVVCWNPMCKPPDADCGKWHRGRPAWPWHEWEWLADRLIVADPAVSVPPPATFWDDPEIFATVHSGRSGIDQAVAIVPPHNDHPQNDDPDQPGQPVRFVGGPFDGQLRRFIDIAPVLTATQPEKAPRPRLDAADAADRLGAYHFALVNDEPSYVWVTPIEGSRLDTQGRMD